MVRELCGKENWETVKECFSNFQVPNITACALPILPTQKEIFHKSTTILNWWNSIEQRSMELALEYRYMFMTDITNCYGSINPQSIDRAFAMAGTPFATTQNSQLSSSLQRMLCDMQQGFNMGIPQGSTLFDLIAEVVLGYADLLLHVRLQEEGIAGRVGYEILRYRDDYRIFCNDKETLDRISYLLQEVLLSLHFQMNSKKTRISADIMQDGVKEDKLDYIINTPVFKANGTMDFTGFQKYLMFILMFGRKHHDCGMLRTMLSDLDQRIASCLNPADNTRKVSFSLDNAVTVDLGEPQSTDEPQKPILARYSEVLRPARKLKENIKVMASIATQIALENNSASIHALRVISRMLTDLSSEPEQRNEIVDLVRQKMMRLPNSVYLQPWIQNMALGLDAARQECPYTMPLCHLAMGERVEVWNNDWLKPALVKGLPLGGICDKKRITELKEDPSPVIKLVIRNSYADMELMAIEN